MRRIEMMPVDGLPPALSNPKQHDVEDIAASIERFGFVEPVVLDERTGRLVAGHGRIEGLALLWAAEVAAPEGVEEREGRWFIPVVRGWSSRTDEDAASFLVAVNQLVISGGWDFEALGSLMRAIDDTGADVETLGFSDEGLEDLLSAEPRSYRLSVICATEVERHRIAAMVRERGASARYL